MTASDHKELCERLRAGGNGFSLKNERGDYGVCNTAADAIEALVRDRDVWRECCNKISNRMIRPHSRADIMDLVREAEGLSARHRQGED